MQVCYVCVGLVHRFLIPSQIIDPHDSGIGGSILLNLKPDKIAWNPETFLGSGNCIDRTEELTQAYFEYISGLRTMYAQVSWHGINNRWLKNSLETTTRHLQSNS